MDIQQVSLFDAIADGAHERCNNPRCRKQFPFLNGMLIRVRGMDDQYYCDVPCASARYLDERSPVIRRFSGC
jgi:hypothetical protein